MALIDDDRDIALEADRHGTGIGRMLFRIAGRDIAAIENDGTGTGLFASGQPVVGGLTAVAIQNGNYLANAGELVPVGATGGNVTVTLPNAPANGVRVAVKVVAVSGGHSVTVACAGSDVLNKAAGPTSLSLSLLNQGVILNYKATGGIWYVEVDDITLTALDARYPQAALDTDGTLAANSDTRVPSQKAVKTAISALDSRFPVAALDTDVTLAANSDARVPSQKAIKAYANAVSLVATPLKTTGYTAAAGDLVPVDTTSTNVTVTLPNAPMNATKIGVKHVIQGGTNTVTIACAGIDVFNKAGGSTSMTLQLVNQGALLQYDTATHIWYIEADDLSLATLDTRYQDRLSVLSYGAKGDNSTDDLAAIQTAQAAALAQKKWLYFPYGASGIYKISAGLTVSPHEKWVFDGVQDVRIVYAGAANGTILQPADSTAVTDYVQIQYGQFDGGNLADIGWDLKSCAEWKTFNCQVSNCNLAPVRTYGQRTATGTTNPSDSTYNKHYNLRALGGCVAGVWLTGTKARTSTTTTLSASVTGTATTVNVADTSAFAASGVLLVDDEWIAYSGKGAAQFTGCTRGYWDSVPAAHSNGATIGVAARLSGGASNLNAFYSGRFASQTKSKGTVTVTVASPAVFTRTSHCLVAGDPVYLETTGALPTGLVADTVYYVISTGLTADTFQLGTSTNTGSVINTSGTQSGTHTLFRNRVARGFWVQQGSANFFAHTSANITDGEGMMFSWYGNTAVGGVVENTGALGVYQIGFDETTSECHDNYVFGVSNGGSSGAAGLYPVISKNTVIAYGAAIRMYGLLHGEVNSDGSIARGTGFTVTKNGTGDYTVNFTQLPATPVVITTRVSGAAGMISVSSKTSSTARILTWNSSAVATDTAFTFEIKVPG